MGLKMMMLADGLIPGAKPTQIPGMSGPVTKMLGYALWGLVIAGSVGAIIGIYGSEPFKWMGGGLAAIIISSSLIAILNGIAGG